MNKSTKAWWNREVPLQIRVFGEPQPFPKKDVAIQGNRLVPVDKDYRERKDPITGEKKKYDRGYKRRWMKHVRDIVGKAMITHRLEPFPENHPVAMGCQFYLRRAKSNKLIYPSQKPDEDNFLRAIRDALQRHPIDEYANDRFALTGVLYYDDCQVVSQLLPAGKEWATEDEPPGVLITVQDMFMMESYR